MIELSRSGEAHESIVPMMYVCSWLSDMLQCRVSQLFRLRHYMLICLLLLILIKLLQLLLQLPMLLFILFVCFGFFVLFFVLFVAATSVSTAYKSYLFAPYQSFFCQVTGRL